MTRTGGRTLTRSAGEAATVPREVVLVWLLLAAVTVEVFVTYWRLPAHELYHVSRTGIAGGAGRAVVLLNFPVALVAIAVLAILAEQARARLEAIAAVVGIALCSAVFWPGVVDQADLDAKPVNAIPALGVAIAIVLTLAAARGGIVSSPASAPALDRARIAVAAVVLVLAVPWLAADLGLSFDGVPVLGTLYQTGELRAQPGHPEPHPAVHHGHHHGMDGALLAFSSLLLSRTLVAIRRGRLRAALAAYLALMLTYGLGNIANDFWLEQVVKRGWTDWEIPGVTVPELSVAWGIIVLAAATIWATYLWRTGHRAALDAAQPPL